MSLRTKLVLSAMGVTFAMVLVLSTLFLGELLRQRIAQTTADNEVLAHEVLLMTRQAIEAGLLENPPVDNSATAFSDAVTEALQSYDPLLDTMNAIIRYSPTVQDVSVTDAHGLTLVSTDPDAIGQAAAKRTALSGVRDGSILYQAREMFGQPHVLDVAMTLDRNGVPLVLVHVGIRSSFLRANYEPWLHAAMWFAFGAAILSMLAAALLASAALKPLRAITAQLEHLTQPVPVEEAAASGPPVKTTRVHGDAVIQVKETIDRLGRQIRSTEAGYTALQANLNQMLDTLRDGVLLFTADGRSVMVSDAVANFIGERNHSLIGKSVDEIFDARTALGAAVLMAFAEPRSTTSEVVTLEDGRKVQLSLDRIDDGHEGSGTMGTLLTLRDIDSAMRLEQELEVSRRLVAIGRLTAGVGHEVKNPINAMVLHLELLRSKLTGEGKDALIGAQRHVDILAGEMQRLDRVVQTLADFTRPMELHLERQDLRKIFCSVADLTGEEMREGGVDIQIDTPPYPMMVRIDTDLIRQSILNLLLNAQQAMPEGGSIRVRLFQERQNAVVEITDEGVGIPPEVLPRIFDLYFTTKPTGSGIGLAMTYRILQMHGGTMEVRSSTDRTSIDRGSTFTFRLPITLSSANADSIEPEELSGAKTMELERQV